MTRKQFNHFLDRAIAHFHDQHPESDFVIDYIVEEEEVNISCCVFVEYKVGLERFSFNIFWYNQDLPVSKVRKKIIREFYESTIIKLMYRGISARHKFILDSISNISNTVNEPG